MANRLWTFARRIVLGLLAVVGLGYLSGAVSRGSCERAAALQLERELGTKRVFVLSGGERLDYPGSAATLSRAGFRVEPCQTTRERFDCYPWAALAPARVSGPFLVDVEWSFVAAPLAGHGTRTRFLVFFGWVIPVRDFGGWVT